MFENASLLEETSSMKAKIKRSFVCSARSTIAVLMAVSGSIFISGISQAAAAADVAVREDASKSATSPAAAKVSKSASPVGGTRDGIGVHGWWTIDVRNPDGSLDRHLEFENQLCTGFTDIAVPGLGVVPGGDSILSTATLGNYATGAWSIILGAPEVPIHPTTVPTCAIQYTYILSSSPGSATPLSTPGGPISWNCTADPCFPALKVGAVSNAAGTGSSISLSGQLTVPAGAAAITISAVGTDVYSCSTLNATLNNSVSNVECGNIPGWVAANAPNCAVFSLAGAGSASEQTNIQVTCPNVSPISLITYPVANQPGRAPFSGVVLTGTNGIPGPLTLVAGQVVSVTWTLSFQ
jgi:hypothetical protein